MKLFNLTILEKEDRQNVWINKFCDYRTRAKARNFDFSISLEEFKVICSKPCFYCLKSPPVFTRLKKKKEHYTEENLEKQNILANGIDRFDNNKGYTLENSVACCSACNRAKADMSAKEYIDLCKKVAYNFKDDN